MPSCPDRRGRFHANVFDCEHARTKRTMAAFDMSDVAAALADEIVDHVCVWPQVDREPGTTYDRSHFRIVQDQRIVGFTNTKKPRFFFTERDPRLAGRPVSWADAVARVQGHDAKRARI